MTLLDSTKPKEIVEDNFRINESVGKFTERVQNDARKKRNCSLRSISPFPTEFSKVLYCRHVKTMPVWERVKNVDGANLLATRQSPLMK